MTRSAPWLCLLVLLTSGIIPALGLVQSGHSNAERSLHFILFEDYPFNPDSEATPRYRHFDLPSAEFPHQFSIQYAPFHTLPRFKLPQGIRIPRKKILIGIHTLPERRLRRKILYRSHFNRLSYQVRASHLGVRDYQLTLDGEYGGFKFEDILVEGKWDRTKLVTIRKTSRQTLFAAFTPVRAIPLLAEEAHAEGEFREPALVEGPRPATPEGLPEEGRVLIRGIIDSHGRLDPDRFVLLESPHPQLGRRAVETVLDDWQFAPGTRNGSPVDALKTIEVRFRPRRVTSPGRH